MYDQMFHKLEEMECLREGISLNYYSTLNILRSPPLTNGSFSCGELSELKAKMERSINDVFLFIRPYAINSTMNTSL